MEYLDEKGEYASPEGVEPIKKNKELGQFLVDIEELADSLQPPFERPDLSKFTLMLSVVGVPYAGSHLAPSSMCQSMIMQANRNIKLNEQNPWWLSTIVFPAGHCELHWH